MRYGPMCEMDFSLLAENRRADRGEELARRPGTAVRNRGLERRAWDAELCGDKPVLRRAGTIQVRWSCDVFWVKELSVAALALS